MIYRVFPTKDTFITSFRRYNVAQTGSNLGKSEILHVFKQVAATASLAPGLGRILMRFPIEEIGAVTGSEQVSGPVTYRLRLKNAQHDKTLPSSFSFQIQAVSEDWDEGRGHDTDVFRDKGVANWDKRKSNLWWATAGASGSGPIVEAFFDQGDEDMDVDVTSIVSAWQAGLPNYGFLIKLSGTLESDSNDYYVKMFHSRESFFPDKLPHLEARWSDVVQTGSIATGSDAGPYFVDIPNLKYQYQSEEEVQLRLFVRKHDYNPAVVLIASSSATGIAIPKAYWRITNDRTDAVVVPFGTGSDLSTKLSYDNNGNYFKLYMKSLPAGEVYRVAFLFDVAGQKQLIDEDFKFRVV